MKEILSIVTCLFIYKVMDSNRTYTGIKSAEKYFSENKEV